jgi:cell division protein FtsQ
MTAMIHRNASGIVTIAVVLVAAAAGVLGYRFLMNLPLEHTVVAGNVRADANEILDLAEIDTSLALYRLEGALIADRVERHPWVEEASILRLPTGTMRIGVKERRPVVQVLDGSGRVAWYLDRTGAMMPAPDVSDIRKASDDGESAEGAAAASRPVDAPILSGLLDDYHPMHEVDSGALVEFLGILPDLPRDTQQLISEIILVHTASSEDIQLRLTPIEGRPSIRVRLGDARFERGMKRLRAFWDQQIARHPDVRYDVVDLRYDSRVITRESPDPLSH